MMWIQGLTNAATTLLFLSAVQGNEQQRIGISHMKSQSFVGRTALLDLHRQLVEIESISGNEHAVGNWLASYLEDKNFTVELQQVPSLQGDSNGHPRHNIFAYRGKRDAPVLLTSHIDTVPPFYAYEVQNKTDIFGRGVVDAKGCVATQIIALLSLLEDGRVSEDDVALLYVVGEEVSGDGMRAANDLAVEWEAVIFGEPTELKLAAGHKGAMLLEITAHGKSGHSGYPDLGENAIDILLPALTALKREALPSSEKYGNTTLNIGRLEGGVAANVIPERAYATAQIRLAAGTPTDIKAQLTKVLHQVDDRLELKFGLGYGPVPCNTDIDGFEVITVNYGTDIPNLKGTHKRYLYGPGSILVAHSDHEHLELSDLVSAVEGYQKIILGTLGDAND